MKVQRSSIYAHFRKAVRFVSVAAVLTSFALGAACARKPGDNSVPVGQANGELLMEMKLKESFPEFDWKAKQNKELAAKLQGATLRTTLLQAKEKDVTRVDAELLVQLEGESNLLHAKKELTSGKAVAMEMSDESNPAFKVDARCLDKTCDIVAALVTETATIEGGLTRTADQIVFEDEEPLAEAPAILAAAGVAPVKAADATVKPEAKAEDDAADVEDSTDASKSASTEPKKEEAKNDTKDEAKAETQPAAPAKEPAKVEDKNKIVRRVALVFRQRQADPSMKPEAVEALKQKEGNMELIFSSSPSEDFKAGKSKVGVKITAPVITPSGEQKSETGAATGDLAEAAARAEAEANEKAATQPLVNAQKQTENLK